MYGWMGTILRVDLTSGKVEKETLGEELRRNYIGGRGINVKILYDEVKPGIHGLDPGNVLIFGTGPLTGTSLASGRINITAMSPLTKILGDSNGGSHFSPELKFAGYDHIVFTGKADKPVYLWIDNDEVELRDAEHLWGKLTDETERIIKEEVGDPRIQVACIGPAGERLVRVASIIIGTDGACARCGLGAVMGSKNLKAVAVRGTKGVKVAQIDVFRALVKDLIKRTLRNPIYPRRSKYGTTGSYEIRSALGSLSMRNAKQSGSFWGVDEIKAETLHEKYSIKNKACFGCINHCRSWFEIKEGPYAGLGGVGIELSIQESWGSLNDNAYAPSLYKGFILCNQYGMDALECGQILAAATEWYEMGLFTKEDAQGIELKWGDHDAMIKMTHKIANREGIGDILAEGGLRAAQKLGRNAERCITHVKGVLKTNVDLRSSTTYAFGHAIATRGADHLRGAVPMKDVPGQYEGIAKAVHENNYICTIADALELCKFHTTYIRLELTLKEAAELFSAVTGLQENEEGMRKIADRIWNLERAFIVREGISRKDDILVGRYMNEPVNGGILDGLKYDQEKWDRMLDDYYDLNGWDKNGIPARATLEALGLKDIADELESIGKLPKME